MQVMKCQSMTALNDPVKARQGVISGHWMEDADDRSNSGKRQQELKNHLLTVPFVRSLLKEWRRMSLLRSSSPLPGALKPSKASSLNCARSRNAGTNDRR